MSSRKGPNAGRTALVVHYDMEAISGLQRVRHAVWQTGRAVIIAEQPFDDERQAESEDQPVKMIELLQAPQEQPLDDDAGGANHNRHDNQCRPIADADVS